MLISFLTLCASLFFVAVCAPVCLISFFASVSAHLPICILFCIVHPFIFYSLSPLSRCLSPALKAKQHAHSRTHTAEECRNDYAAELQKYNKEQNFFYYTEIPQIFNVRPTQMHTFPVQWNGAQHFISIWMYIVYTSAKWLIWDWMSLYCVYQTENAGHGWATDSTSGRRILSVFRHWEESAAHHLQVFRRHLYGREENWWEAGTFQNLAHYM